jgi:hypothetical protein
MSGTNASATEQEPACDASGLLGWTKNRERRPPSSTVPQPHERGTPVWACAWTKSMVVADYQGERYLVAILGQA